MSPEPRRVCGRQGHERHMAFGQVERQAKPFTLIYGMALLRTPRLGRHLSLPQRNLQNDYGSTQPQPLHVHTQSLSLITPKPSGTTAMEAFRPEHQVQQSAGVAGSTEERTSSPGLSLPVSKAWEGWSLLGEQLISHYSPIASLPSRILWNDGMSLSTMFKTLVTNHSRDQGTIVTWLIR